MHKKLNFCVGQFLTGHIVFGRIGKSQEDTCCYCNNPNNPEHLSVCHMWKKDIQNTQKELETVQSPENIIEHMVEGEDKWDKMSQLITIITKVKERDEGERQHNQSDI